MAAAVAVMLAVDVAVAADVDVAAVAAVAAEVAVAVVAASAGAAAVSEAAACRGAAAVGVESTQFLAHWLKKEGAVGGSTTSPSAVYATAPSRLVRTISDKQVEVTRAVLLRTESSLWIPGSE
jgi:hypothetical protein